VAPSEECDPQQWQHDHRELSGRRDTVGQIACNGDEVDGLDGDHGVDPDSIAPWCPSGDVAPHIANSQFTQAGAAG
jgi:hypothetical protein